MCIIAQPDVYVKLQTVEKVIFSKILLWTDCPKPINPPPRPLRQCSNILPKALWKREKFHFLAAAVGMAESGDGVLIKMKFFVYRSWSTRTKGQSPFVRSSRREGERRKGAACATGSGKSRQPIKLCWYLCSKQYLAGLKQNRFLNKMI